MPYDDPLTRLLRAADELAGAPTLPADLAGQVRQQRTELLVRERRIKIATSAAAVGLVLVGSFVAVRQNGPTLNRSTADEIAQLRAQVDALAFEANALQHEIAAAQAEQSRQDLRDEYRRQLAANVDSDIAQSPIERAAAIALCQGDYYWEVQKNRAPAQAAYQSILEYYPGSSLAAVAQARLQLLQMN